MKTHRRPFLLRRRGRAPRGYAPTNLEAFEDPLLTSPAKTRATYLRGLLNGIAAGILLGSLLRFV